jgi:hypothetical protein
MKLAIVMVFCLLVGIMPSHGEAGTTGQEDSESCIPAEVIIGAGVISMPLGRILLVHKGAHYCAVKFTEGWTGKTIFDCFENYESYDLGDGTGDILTKNIPCEKGQLISRGPLCGRLLPFSAGRKNQDLKCGPITLFWTVGGVYFCDLRDEKHCDYGTKFAPTKWTDISQVNLFDPRLTWYRYDGKRKAIFIPIDQLWEDEGEQKK